MSTVEAPKIVITEPSPMPPPKEGKVPKEDEVPKKEVASVDEMRTVSIPATIEVAVSGEFNPIGGEGSNAEPQEDLPERESQSSEIIPYYSPNTPCSLLHYCRLWTKNCKLKCLILFDTILLPVFVSAVYMGAANVGKCKLNDSMPIVLFVMGVTGFATAAYSLVLTVRKYGKERNESGTPAPQPTPAQQPNRDTNQDGLVLPGAAMTIMLLATEGMLILLLKPSYEPEDKKYCDKTFYTYVQYTVYCALAVLGIVVAFLALEKLLKYINDKRAATQESENVQ